VTDQAPGGDQRGRRGYLAVGNTEQNGVGIVAVGAATKGSEHLVWAVLESLQGVGQGISQATATNHGKPRSGKALRGGIPFQFPHERYRSVLSERFDLS
jgi:hypothetical protein